MKYTIRHHRKFLQWTLLLALPLAVVGSPAGFREISQLGDAVIELPSKIVTGFRSFSLDRLDPTCPQCI